MSDTTPASRLPIRFILADETQVLAPVEMDSSVLDAEEVWLKRNEKLKAFRVVKARWMQVEDQLILSVIVQPARPSLIDKLGEMPEGRQEFLGIVGGSFTATPFVFLLFIAVLVPYGTLGWLSNNIDSGIAWSVGLIGVWYGSRQKHRISRYYFSALGVSFGIFVYACFALWLPDLVSDEVAASRGYEAIGKDVYSSRTELALTLAPWASLAVVVLNGVGWKVLGGLIGKAFERKEDKA